jgi:hypothetical protein
MTNTRQSISIACMKWYRDTTSSPLAWSYGHTIQVFYDTQFYYFLVATEKGHYDELQERVRAHLKEHGGEYIIIHSLDHFKEEINSICGKESD